MDYIRIYVNLIKKGLTHNYIQQTERHHIIPQSLGGTNNIDNIVYLPLREHYVAHLLLYKIFRFDHPNQIFAIECFYDNNRYQHLDIHNMPKWVRRKLWLRKQALFREKF